MANATLTDTLTAATAPVTLEAAPETVYESRSTVYEVLDAGLPPWIPAPPTRTGEVRFLVDAADRGAVVAILETGNAVTITCNTAAAGIPTFDPITVLPTTVVESWPSATSLGRRFTVRYERVTPTPPAVLP